MRFVNYIIAISFIKLFTSCGNEVEVIKSDEIIVDASVIKYSDLEELDKSKMKYDCHCFPKNWNQGVITLKDSTFFIKAKINNSKLAKISESNAFPIKELLSDNLYMLYGKYKNRWKLMNSRGMKICETDKFDGFSILTIQRNGDYDEIIIGPIPEKPSKIIIELSDSENYPNLTPTYCIN